MKKKFVLIIALILTITASFSPIVAYANMAMPKPAGVASNITFSQNDDIAVTKEVLDIVVKDAFAEISATYYMKNSADKNISIKSMFMSPNIENKQKVSVMADGVSLEVATKTYNVGYKNENITTEDGKIIIVEPEILSPNADKVDTIEFEIPFEANDEVVVSVKYMYKLGGYPNLAYNAKRGEIEYYLTIASFWKDFSDLTINLTLDSGMPVLEFSNLEFKKIDKFSYQYKSDTLPKENLKIRIDETPWQEFIGGLKSPYAMFWMIPLLCLILIIAIIITAYILIKRAVKKKKAMNGKDTIDKKNL